MKTRRKSANKNTRRFSICATSIAAFMAASPDSPGNNFDVNLGDTLPSGAVVGATGLTKIGGGALLLQSGNTYTGTTTIADGSVVITDASALGLDPSTILVTSFNPTIGQVGNVRGFGGGSLVLGGLGGAITISRGLSLQGQGPISDRGAALINIGDNVLSGAVATAPVAPGTATNIVTSVISAFGNLNFSGTLNLGGAAIAANTIFGGVNQGGVGNFTISGTLAGLSTISKQGGGTLFLNPSNTAGFAGSIRTNGAAFGQSTVRISQPNVLGTRFAGGTGAVIDLNGGALEVLMDSPSVLQAGTAPANVYGRAGTTLFVDKSVGGSASDQTVAFGQFAFEENQTFTFANRNGYGASFTTAPVQGGNNNSTFNNNFAGGLLSFTGNFWSNTDNGANRTFTLGGNGNTLIDGNIVATAAAFNHNFTKGGTGTLTVQATGTTLDGNFTIGDGNVVTRRIVGALLGGGTAAGNLNLGAGGATGTLNFLGDAGSGAGEVLSRTLGLTGAAGGGRINANQAGSAATALVIAGPINISATAKTLTLGGTSVPSIENEISSVITNAGTAGNALNLAKTDSNTWVLSGANTYTGTTTISNGTLKLKAAAGASDVLQDVSTIAFNADGVQAAGGRMVLAGNAGGAATETIGNINALVGHGTIRVENAGANTTLAVTGLTANSSTLSTSVNFEATAPLEIITLGGAFPTGFVRGSTYFNGANFAFADSTTTPANQLRAPVYGTDAGFVNAAAALTAAAHNNITAATADAGGTYSSLRFDGSHTLTLTGTAAVNLGAQTIGGILVNGGNAVIAQGGGGAITQGLGAAAAGGAPLAFRINQLTDSLDLQVPITSSSTQGITKNGLGTLILSATNVQTGATTITKGTVRLGTGGRLSAANQALSIRQGATFDLNGVAQPNNTIGAFNGAGTVTNTNATAAEFAFGANNTGGTFSGVIQDGVGRVNVLKQSTGAPVLTGMNTYTGSTTIASTGTLNTTILANIGSPSSIGRGDSASVATNQASLVFTGAQLVSAATGLSLPGGLIYQGTAPVSTDRLFSLGSTAAGAGARITANGVNNVNLDFTNTGAIGYTAAGATVAQNLVLAGASTGDNRIDIQLVDSGAVGGSLRVNKIEAGKWVLGNTSNSYSGATKINGGTLEANGLSLPATSALLFGGTLAIPAGGVLETSGSFTRAINPGTVANTVNFNANGNFAGSGGFASSGDKLTVNLGGASAPLTWGGGGFLMPGTAAATLRLSSPTALGEVDFQNPIDLGALTRTIQVDDNGNIGADFATLSGALSGAGAGISKTGGGFLSLSGANTYTGTTAVTAGVLVVRSLGNSGGGASSVGDGTVGNTDAGAVLLGNGATGGTILQYVGSGETSDRKIRLNTTVANTQISADGSGALILTNVANDVATGAKGLFLRGSNSAGNRIDNTLTDSPLGLNTTAQLLSVTVDGSATWILNAANSYTGNTNVSAGAVGVGNNAAFGPSGVVVASNSNLFAFGADRTVANIIQIQNNTVQGFLGDFSLAFSAPLRPQGGGTLGINNNIGSSTGAKTLTFGGIDLNTLTANRALTVDGPGETIISGDIINTSTTAFGLGIVKTGTGILALNGGGSNFTRNGNNVDIDNGTVRLGAANAIPSGAGFGGVVFSPDNAQAETATLNLNGNSVTLNSLTDTPLNSSSAKTIDNASGSAVTLTVGAFGGAVNTNAAITATGGGPISIVKAGSAVGVLSGTSIAIAGTTTVQEGSLAFTADDPENTTGISVAGGASLSLRNGTGSSFASLASLNIGLPASTAAASLALDVGTITDTLAIGAAATTAGTVNLSFGAAPGFGGSPTYIILQAASGLSGATYGINGVVPGGFTYSLTTSDTSVILNATPSAGVDFFWRGDQSNSWSTYNAGNTNWDDVAGNDTAAVPGPLDIVVFSSVLNPPATTVVTTLDQPIAIDSLQFNGSTTSTAGARVNIAPGTNGTLTIKPASVTDGIELPDNGGVASITAPIVLAGHQTWTVGSVGSPRPELIVTGVLSNGVVAGDLTKLGAGTATITGVASTRTGRTAIDAGTLRIQAEASLGANPGALTADQLSLNGGTLRSIAALVIDDTNRGIEIGGLNGVMDTAGGNITVGSTAAPSLNVISGSGTLRKESGNTLILNSVNTYAGGTFVNGGAVRAGNSAALGSGPLTLGNTVQFEMTDGVNVANAVTVSNNVNDKTIRTVAGTTTAQISGPITIGEQTIGNFRAQATAGATLTLSGVISSLDANSTAGIRVNEVAGQTGVLVLSGANTYLGPTEVRQGTLRNGASDVIPNNVVVNAAIAANPSATYDLAGNNEAITGLTYGANASSTAAYVNSVTTGAGTLTLDGNVTTVANPGGSSVGTAVLSGNVALSATRTFTVANATTVATDLLVSAVISGVPGAGLTKLGAGTLQLTAANTYTGTTTVTAGTLLLTGSISASPLVVGTGGTFSPGGSIGPTAAASLTMSGTGTFALEINTASLATDLLSTTAPLTLALTPGSPLTVTDLGGNVPLLPGTKFTFITYNGAQTGLFSFGGTPIIDDTTLFTVGANEFTIDYNDFGGTAVSLVVVPEPGIAASLLGGFGMLVGLQRIRRRSDRRS